MTPQDKLKQLFSQSQNPATQSQSVNPATETLQRIFTPKTPTFPEITQKPGFGGAVVSAIAPVVDFLSRPQYASATFFDGLFEEGKSVFDLISDSFNELIDPKARLSYSDIIKRRAPEFAKNNPKATAVLGFLGDVALDPTTYLGVGLAGKGIKVGGKVVTQFGKEVLQKSISDLTGRTVFTAFEKGVEKDVVKAASRGITATVENLSPFKVKKEIKALQKEFGDELQALGIADIQQTLPTGQLVKKPSKQLALADVGINDLPPEGFTSKLVRRTLSSDEVIERAEQRITRLTELDPKFAQKVFEQPKLSLKIGIPFGPQKELLNITGLGPLKRSVDFVKALNETVIDKQIPLVSQTAKALKAVGETGKFIRQTGRDLFTRPTDQPFKTVITEIENEFDSVEINAFRESKKIFSELKEDERATLTKTLRDIEDRTRQIEFAAEFTEGRAITQAEADNVYNTVLSQVNLNPKQMSIVANLRQAFATTASLEMEVDLLKSELKNYIPRYYESIENAKDLTAITKQKYGLSTFLTSSQQRKYTTIAEAEAAGLIPELDAAMIYATRVSSSRRALAKKQFFDSLSTVFDTKISNQNDLAKLAKIPGGKRYLEDIKLLGESVYPTGLNDSSKAFLKAIDGLTGAFRKAATVFKPSFAPKQAISNTSQIMLELGLKGAKTLDPRALVDTSMLLFDFYRGAKTSKLPDYISNIFAKNFGKAGEKGADAVIASRVALERIIGEERLLDVIPDYALVNAFGQKFSGDDIVRGLRENGIIRSSDSLGNTFKQNLKEYLEYDPNNKWMVTQELAKFWKYPSIVEDYGRAVAFMGFVRQGYSFKEAANQVNKVLFDYQRGLTSFEKSFVKRVVPFYTFQRFAIPFVLRKIVESPGTVAASNKIANLFEKLLVSEGEQLSPSEREIFGDSLYIEQPRIFSGFDKEGKAKFNILNNMTPLDALSLFVYDPKTNELDVGRSVQRSVLAALTPFLKIPLETALDKNFFTGKAISDAGRLGNLPEGIGRILPNSVKEFIGYENRVNLRSGKTSTYVNPYLAYYSFSLLPALKQYIQPFDKDRSVVDSAMELITGIAPKNVDLKELREFQALGAKAKIDEYARQIRGAKIKGATTQYEQYLQEYREYLQVIREGNQKKRETEVRGLGINPQAEQVTQEQR